MLLVFKSVEKLFLMFEHFWRKNLFQKCSNLHERSGIGWIERNIKFQIFIVMVILVTSSPQFLMNFHNNSKNKNRRIFLLFIPYYITYSPSSIKGWSKVRGGGGGVCISLIETGPKLSVINYYHCNQFNHQYKLYKEHFLKYSSNSWELRPTCPFLTGEKKMKIHPSGHIQLYIYKYVREDWGTPRLHVR